MDNAATFQVGQKGSSSSKLESDTMIKKAGMSQFTCLERVPDNGKARARAPEIASSCFQSENPSFTVSMQASYTRLKSNFVSFHFKTYRSTKCKDGPIAIGFRFRIYLKLQSW